jgi:hypothetical protein
MDIVQKQKKNEPKWIWQQTNEVALGKTNTHLAKHTVVETQNYKRNFLKINKWWKFKPNIMFLLWKNKNNKHTMLYLYGIKALT